MGSFSVSQTSIVILSWGEHFSTCHRSSLMFDRCEQTFKQKKEVKKAHCLFSIEHKLVLKLIVCSGLQSNVKKCGQCCWSLNKNILFSKKKHIANWLRNQQVVAFSVQKFFNICALSPSGEDRSRLKVNCTGHHSLQMFSKILQKYTGLAWQFSFSWSQCFWKHQLLLIS